jgi:hypothetical protein
MIYENVNFPAEMFERLKILELAEKLPAFEEMTIEQKSCYVKGKYDGWFEGRRHEHAEALRRFSLSIFGHVL